MDNSYQGKKFTKTWKTSLLIFQKVYKFEVLKPMKTTKSPSLAFEIVKTSIHIHICNLHSGKYGTFM